MPLTFSVEFSNAKSGDKTCSVNGKFLHSKYNPKQEGERFAENLAADFSPFCVLILEPALSYSAQFLRKRFPGAKLCCVRFSNDFREYDSAWDFVFYGADENFRNLAEDLFNALGEENLISSLFLDWLPSKNVFPNLSQKAWQEIQKAVLKSRDVLGTRSFFSKRWLKNSVLFCLKIKKGFVFDKISKPVLICASGPSLESSIPFIKKFRKDFCLIAVSSAFSPLLKNGIEPDFTVSSDGGFWAKTHLALPGEKNSNHVFALEAEGAAFSKLYENNLIIPLAYENGLEIELLKSIACPFMFSRRNGTVAGTALEFAFSLTEKNIYLAGFDQAPALGFQHTQPNENEIINQKKDFRLSTKETRTTNSRFGSENSLEIYRNWFVSNSGRFEKRVFRISDNYDFSYNLEKIKDINWNDFEKITENDEDFSQHKRDCFASLAMTENSLAMTKNSLATAESSSETKVKSSAMTEIPFKIMMEKSERKERILAKLREMAKTDFFLDEVFPMDSVLIRREIDGGKKAELREKAREKVEKLIEEIEKKLF